MGSQRQVAANRVLHVKPEASHFALCFVDEEYHDCGLWILLNKVMHWLGLCNHLCPIFLFNPTNFLEVGQERKELQILNSGGCKRVNPNAQA